ncbi:alpha-E domain-containing protein [Emcibacter sp. SYSU 3D8]|uniref:alpha-E domain-containing protein n=1 Tax=Emcibacter sp. SYSU 3D8 TaxID=3133969 RepID=UPI0031FE9AA6
MLSKTAGGLFWMFRYLERCENNARLLDAGFRIALTRSATAAAEWKSVLTTSGSLGDYKKLHGDFVSSNVVDFVLRDPANPSSVISNAKQARDNARLVRTALTREVWEATNECWMTLKALLDKPVPEQELPDTLSVIRQQSALVRGATHGTMMRNDGYHFARLGTFLERADNTARILDVKYYLLLPSIAQIGSSLDKVQWETILRSVSAQRAYRWLNGSNINPLNIAEFLILNDEMPRSLAFSYANLENHLTRLATRYKVEKPSNDRVRSVHSMVKDTHIDQIFEEGLHQFIERFLVENGKLALQIQTDYRFQG